MRASTLYRASSFKRRAPQVPGQQADDDATANTRIRAQVQQAAAHLFGYYSKHAFKARPTYRYRTSRYISSAHEVNCVHHDVHLITSTRLAIGVLYALSIA